MIVGGDYESAKLEAVKKLVEEDVKSVTLYYEKGLFGWCVDWETFSDEEREKIWD